MRDNDYLAAGAFSAADVYLTASLGFGMQFGLVPKLAAFERYVGKHAARPACVRAREIDDGPPV